jgi:hypothetical protein
MQHDIERHTEKAVATPIFHDFRFLRLDVAADPDIKVANSALQLLINRHILTSHVFLQNPKEVLGCVSC